jgi:hypothetical protein
MANGTTYDDALDVDLSEFFPNGAFSVRVADVEGGAVSMPMVHYRVFVSQQAAPAPVNLSIQSHFAIPWVGNVVWLRYNVYDVRDEHLQDPQGPSPEEIAPLQHYYSYMIKVLMGR